MDGNGRKTWHVRLHSIVKAGLSLQTPEKVKYKLINKKAKIKMIMITIYVIQCDGKIVPRCVGL